MNINKEYGGDLCKNHSARSEKEFCRVCPSNLNKKELENVYFTLLENNLDLKTTINSQREKIKILSTKVQRLTALQKTYMGKEPKECSGSKALIEEQKQCIAELRKSNQSLSERVRQLNMRLCSAKQFLKRSPFQSTSRCNRCSNKNISMSGLISKRSEINLRTTAASSQYLVKDILSSRTVDNTLISQEKGVQYDFCDENKCRDHIEELTKKNDDLQEELSRLKEKYASVTSQLESDVRDLRAESVRVRSDRALAEERAEQLRAQLTDVTGRLGSADLRCDELTVELAVEQRRVCELETRLRAADMSTRIADVIQTHLAHVQMAKDQSNVVRDMEAGVHTKQAAEDSTNLLSVQSPQYRPKAAVRTKVPHNVQIDEMFKSSDDSGYTEVNRSQDDDTKASTTVNQMLLEKIADLQNQINNLKAFKNNYNTPNESLSASQDFNIENTNAYRALPDKQQSEENAISESSESVITEKKANIHITETKQNESDKNDDIKPTIKPVNEVKHTPIYREYEHNKTEEQQSESDVVTKPKESLKRLLGRYKDTTNDNKTLTDSRKLSLQSSRESLKEKNIIKTGSLDETRFANVNNVKKIDPGDSNLKSLSKSQVNKSNTGFDDTEGSQLHDKRSQRINEKESVSKSQNKTIVEKPKINSTECTKEEKKDTIITGYTKDENKKESDSSNGTYTIHKGVNIPKLKNGSNEARVNKTEENKSYKAPWTLAADVKRVLNRATSKDMSHRRRSMTSEGTYVKVPRDVSPDSTECEISSMSDLPSERDERAVYIRSPGEERSRTTTTTTTPTPTTTDYGSLSEGELPYLRDTTILSDGEKRLSNAMGKSHSVSGMEATLAAVQRELTRCTQLLRARPHSLDPHT